MLSFPYNGEDLYMYAMELFSETGHIFTSVPEFINHSSERFVYFDNKSGISLSRKQRLMLKNFDNVSRLFSVNGCCFFSINLLTIRKERSQMAHDIHTMLHPIVDSDGTICLFLHDEEIMLSFMGYGCRCILSNWHSIKDEYGCLSNLLDIANFSIEKGSEYFADMVYSLARCYYLYTQPSIYEILPIDFISNAGIDGIDREALDQYIESQTTAIQRAYGDDYVEYDETVHAEKSSIEDDLDMMLLEMDEDEEDNPFDEDIYTENDDDLDFDEEKDEYEFDDVDPEIFLDPTLMVKWLEKNG